MAQGISLKPKTLLLLDAHAIIHRAYHAVPNLTNSKGVPTGALFGIINMLFGILERFKPEAVIACYDLPQPTFRHEVYEKYKANRQKGDDALYTQIESSRKIFEALCIPIFEKIGFEADDILGTIVERSKTEHPDYRIIIASGDQDTLQLVSGDDVIVYTLKKGITDTVTYNEEAVHARYGFGPKQLIDYKGLRGDTSDNIIGVPGVGEKTATLMIQEFGNIESMYAYIDEVKEFSKKDERLKKAGITERFFKLLLEHRDDAIFSKELATIRLDAPIDLQFENIKHWYECVDKDLFEKLIQEYELRSIRGKLDRVIDIQMGKKPVKVVDDTWGVDTAKTGQPTLEGADTALTAEDKIKVWLLKSYLNDPKPYDAEDIQKENGGKSLDEILQQDNMAELYEKVEKPLITILQKMTDTGIEVDVDYLKEMSKKYHAYVDGVQKEIWEMAGEEFNVSSPKQLGVILYDKMKITEGSGIRIKSTAGGAKSTKESELEKMVDAHPIIKKILEYREYTKLLNTYIDVIPTLVDEKSRCHPVYIQTGAVTGRLSCENPNIQNIPIRTEIGRAIRNAFVARKGFTLASLDYSQIELRIAAILSGDKELIDIFRKGEDIHAGVAQRMYKLESLAEVTPEMRRSAKAINFGILYGMGVQALGRGLGVKQAEAQEFYLAYYSTFAGLSEYLKNCKIEAERNGFTSTLFYRRRYFLDIRSNIPFIKAAAERMAINAPIQGTDADMVKMSMVKIDGWIKENKLDDKVHMIAQVHDELLFEIDNKDEKFVEKTLKEIQEMMENILVNFPLMRTLENIPEVPIKVGVKQGKNWGKTEA